MISRCVRGERPPLLMPMFVAQLGEKNFVRLHDDICRVGVIYAIHNVAQGLLPNNRLFDRGRKSLLDVSTLLLLFLLPDFQLPVRS